MYPATGSRLPPEVAALAMALSSVSVVVSSLLLNRYTPPHFDEHGVPAGAAPRESVGEPNGSIEISKFKTKHGVEVAV